MRRLILLLALALMLLPARAARAQTAISSVSGDSNAFVEAFVDTSEPWLGQQITYIFRYFEAVDGGNLPSWIRPPDYEAPEFAGFWVEGEPDVDSEIQERDGRTYNVAELRTVLFPTAAGTLTIPPARLILYDMFEQGERSLETLPVPVNVRELPAPAPDGFDGAVGDFRLTAQTDRTTAPVGEPIQLRLTLTGQGNLHLAPEIELGDLPGWRVLERGSDVLTEVTDGVAGGTRTIDFMLIPGQPGSVTIPPLSLVYFLPAAGEYRTAQTLPLVLTAEGEAPAAAPAAALTSTVDSVAPTPVLTASVPVSAPKLASGAAALNLRTADSLPRQAPPLVREPLFWALWALPAAALVLGVGARRRARFEARNAARAAERARLRAGGTALRALQPPANYGDPVAAATAAQHALGDALQRKLGRPLAGLSHSGIVALLAQQGARPELTAHVAHLLRQGDQMRYAPMAMDWPTAQKMFNEVTAVLRALDRGQL